MVRDYGRRYCSIFRTFLVMFNNHFRPHFLLLLDFFIQVLSLAYFEITLLITDLIFAPPLLQRRRAFECVVVAYRIPP